jgi:hypothetical protein
MTVAIGHPDPAERQRRITLDESVVPAGQDLAAVSVPGLTIAGAALFR